MLLCTFKALPVIWWIFDTSSEKEHSMNPSQNFRSHKQIQMISAHGSPPAFQPVACTASTAAVPVVPAAFQGWQADTWAWGMLLVEVLGDMQAALWHILWKPQRAQREEDAGCPPQTHLHRMSRDPLLPPGVLFWATLVLISNYTCFQSWCIYSLPMYNGSYMYFITLLCIDSCCHPRSSQQLTTLCFRRTGYCSTRRKTQLPWTAKVLLWLSCSLKHSLKSLW